MSQLEMAQFTVVTRRGEQRISYCANVLTIGLMPGTWKSALNFICSGRMTSVPVEDVEAIEFRATGRQHCDMCDERLTSHAVLD